MHYRAAGAVAGVEHHLDAARIVELGGDFGDVGRHQVGRLLAAFAGGQVAGFNHAVQLLDGFAVNRGVAAHRLEAIELGRIVATRDHDAASRLLVEDRVIQHGRRDHSEIGDVTTAGLETAHQGISQTRRAETGVAAERDVGSGVALQVGAEGLTEGFDAIAL